MPSPSHTSPNASGAREFVKQSSLYQEFLAEREEILRHKWLESERLGYDIGFERALLDWIRKHRDSWRAARRAQGGAARSPMPMSMPQGAGGSALARPATGGHASAHAEAAGRTNGRAH